MAQDNVGIFIFDDVEVLDFTGPFEVFSRTRLVGGVDSRRTSDTAPFNVFTVARSDQAITAIGGLQILPQYPWSSAPSIDILVIPGGFGTRSLLKDALAIDWVQNAAKGALLVTSVCTGALLLAQAGLLRHHHATTHTGAYDLLATIDPTIVVERGVRVVHDRVITSAGVSAGIDMAFDVVELRFGRDVARETAEYLEFRRSDVHIQVEKSAKSTIGTHGATAVASSGAPALYPPLLARAAAHAERYLSTIHERHVGALASGDELRRLLRCPLSENGEESNVVRLAVQRSQSRMLERYPKRYR